MKKLLSLALLATALLLAGCDKLSSPPAFKNTDLTGLDYAKGFSLTDHTGQPRTLADFRGKLVVLFFGYTQCPDVCPTTMAEMAAEQEFDVTVVNDDLEHAADRLVESMKINPLN